MICHDFDIDLVYLWVDGSEPHWLSRKNAFLQKAQPDLKINSVGRYEDNDELKYSLRSAEKYIPWIRKIFIVTDNQTPEWLDVSNPKIQIVDHKEIIPSKGLPCYNSGVIEHFLCEIPELSEHFLYANDDMFFNAPLDPSFFFTEQGVPIVRLIRKAFGKWRYRWKKIIGKDFSHYRKMILDAAFLVEKKAGVFYSGIPHHNVDAYIKSDFQKAIESSFKEQVDSSLQHHFRSKGDLQRAAFSFLPLAMGKAQLKYIKRSESYRIHIDKDYQKSFDKVNPMLFCLNDNERATNEDRKKTKVFLDKLFPEKSSLEK